ncbi:MAG: hypothetical protein ACI865_001154 [Flavobacteriaceae bacterium]
MSPIRGCTLHTPDSTQGNLPTPPEGEVVFFEIYKNLEAFNAHVTGPLFTSFVEEYRSLFLASHGAPYVTFEVMNRQAGFIREQAV